MLQDGEQSTAGIMASFNQFWIKIPLTLLIMCAIFVSGIYIGKTGTVFGKTVPIVGMLPMSEAAQAKENVDLTEFWKVWGILNDKFVSASSSAPLSEQDKVRGAIAGLVKAFGDPYTTYFPPKDAEQFQDTISGNFSGVGMEVGMRKDIITIIAPLPGTPAEKAGLISGDVIVSIDKKSTEGMSIDEAVRMIRGRLRK